MLNFLNLVQYVREYFIYETLKFLGVKSHPDICNLTSSGQKTVSCVYLCVCVYIYTYNTYTYIHMCAYICIHTHTRERLRICKISATMDFKYQWLTKIFYFSLMNMLAKGKSGELGKSG